MTDWRLDDTKSKQTLVKSVLQIVKFFVVDDGTAARNWSDVFTQTDKRRVGDSSYFNYFVYLKAR